MTATMILWMLLMVNSLKNITKLDQLATTCKVGSCGGDDGGDGDDTDGDQPLIDNPELDEDLVVSSLQADLLETQAHTVDSTTPGSRPAPEHAGQRTNEVDNYKN